VLLIRCPYCEAERPEAEFTYAGEAHIARPADPSVLTDEEWKNHLFIRSNPRGTHFERWRHVHGCGRFFNAVRDTVSDKFFMTYKAGLPRPSSAEIEAEASTRGQP
jgi:sarcosine oxidase subunit delta